MTRNPVVRPDGSIFRSWRTGTPDPAWGLIPIDGAFVRQRRLELEIGGQRRLAEWLSNRLYEYRQPEIAELEHGGCFVNRIYLLNLAQALEVPTDTLVMQPPAPVPEPEVAHALHQ